MNKKTHARFSMVDLTIAELDRIDALITCIDHAIDRLSAVDRRYANDTKLQKLLFLAIDEFDIDVAYSWYLAGAVVPDTPADSDVLQADVDSPPEPSLPDHDTSDTPEPASSAPQESNGDADKDMSEPSSKATENAAEPDRSTADVMPAADIARHEPEFEDMSATGPDIPTEVDIPVDDVVEFYVEVIPEVWHQRTMMFLQNFYTEHAPEEYRELYIHSTRFRSHLQDIQTAVETRVEGDEPTDESVAELSEEAGLIITDLHLALRNVDGLQTTFEDFVYGTNLIEDGLMMLAEREPTKLSGQHVLALERMSEFFYYTVWRYPCLLISLDTVSGPSAEALRKERQQTLDNFPGTLEQEANRLEETLSSTGLLPEYADYELNDDEVDAQIKNLASQYIR